jgi:hypothetical protein
MTDAHPLDQRWGDPLGIRHGFIRRHIEMQILLMNTSKGTEVGTKRSPCALAGIAMDLALPITIIIPRPFAHTMSNRGMVRMAAAITLPLIGIEPRAADRDVLRDQPRAGARIGVVTDPPALLARVARDDADDGRPIIGVGAVPFALIGAPPGRIRGISMRCAFFPPRFGTARRLRRQCPPSPPSVPSR